MEHEKKNPRNHTVGFLNNLFVNDVGKYNSIGCIIFSVVDDGILHTQTPGAGFIKLA